MRGSPSFFLIEGVPLLFLMIRSAIFVMYESCIDARGVFSSEVKCSSKEPFWFHFPLPFRVPPSSSRLHAALQNCLMISFVLCILSFSYVSHILPHAAVFRYIYFSSASYCVSGFESRLFCSPLILVSRSWCLLLNNYLINS